MYHQMCLQNVIRAALAAAQSQPHDIGSIQMHGTGTPLGDPIEIGALTAILTILELPTGSMDPFSEKHTALMASKSCNGMQRTLSQIRNSLET